MINTRNRSLTNPSIKLLVSSNTWSRLSFTDVILGEHGAGGKPSHELQNLDKDLGVDGVCHGVVIHDRLGLGVGGVDEDRAAGEGVHVLRGAAEAGEHVLIPVDVLFSDSLSPNLVLTAVALGNGGVCASGEEVVGILGFDFLCDGFEFVGGDGGEADEDGEIRVRDRAAPSYVDGGVGGSTTEEIRDAGDVGVVLEVVAYSSEVDEDWDFGLFEESPWSNTAELQDLGGMYCSGGEYYFFLSFDGKSCSGSYGGYKLDAGGSGAVEENLVDTLASNELVVFPSYTIPMAGTGIGARGTGRIHGGSEPGQAIRASIAVKWNVDAKGLVSVIHKLCLFVNIPFFKWTRDEGDVL